MNMDKQEGGYCADLFPLGATPIVLQSSEVVIREVPVQDGWQIDASYDLENPGKGPALFSLVFPESGCAKGLPCGPLGGGYSDLGTRFGETLINPTPAPKEALAPFGGRAAQGHLYRLNLDPLQKVHLSHEYKLDRSVGQAYSRLQYLSAAARFAPPAPKSRLVLLLKEALPYVIHSKAYALKSVTESLDKGGTGSTQRWTFEAASPRDFVAFFPGNTVVGKTKEGFCHGFRGDLDTQELTARLKDAPAPLLATCRQLVFALHGAKRKTEGRPELPPGAAPDLTLSERPESASFRETSIGSIERAYLRALDAAERRRKK